MPAHELKKIIAGRLRELMERDQLTQLAIEQATGIDRTALSEYLREKAMPSAFVIATLALHFRVPTDYLLGLDHTNSSVSLPPWIRDPAEKILATNNSLLIDSLRLVLDRMASGTKREARMSSRGAKSAS